MSIVNVKEYGAAGDSCADDTAAFSAALSVLDEGGLLYIPAGTYLISELRVSADNVFVVGAGVDLTKLIKIPPVHYGRGFSALVLAWKKKSQINNFGIAELTLDGNRSQYIDDYNGSNEECLTVRGGVKCYIKNIKVVNAIRNAIHLDGCINTVVSFCEVCDSGGSGIHFSRSIDCLGTKNSISFCNIVRNTGFAYRKAGMTQNKLGNSNTYIGNVSENNYQNYRFLGKLAVVINNFSGRANTVRDIHLGISWMRSDIKLFGVIASRIKSYLLLLLKYIRNS